MLKTLAPLLIFTSTVFATRFDIRQIPPSTSVEDALNKLEARKELLVNRWAKKSLDQFPFYQSENKGLTSLGGAVARIIKGEDIEAVNDYLLDERFQPGLVGTRITLAGGLIKRKGDYDFALQELIRIAYLGKGVISDKAYERVIHELINVKGTDHYTHFRIAGIRKLDTENHILMTEAARYLNNQIHFKLTGDEKLDNSKNGFDEWMLDHLEYFFVNGLSEINSKPYAGYTIATFLNLYDFAERAEIKEAARILLEYLNMKYAMESAGNRRYPTFRRQYKRYMEERLDLYDSHNAMMMYWIGNYHALMGDEAPRAGEVFTFGSPDEKKPEDLYGDRFSFNAAISTYIPSRIVYENIFEVTESFQMYQLYHDAFQVVYKTQDYVLSGGGVHRKMWPKLSFLNNVLAVPTIIIPEKKGTTLSEMFYFLGRNKKRHRSNLCVGKNFICGLNVHIPKVNEACVEREGEWSFYNFKKEGCNQGAYAGMMLAVYTRELKKKCERKRIAKDFGLMEINNSEMSFSDFKNNILSANTKRFERKDNQKYIMSIGKEVVFNMRAKKGEYNIKGLRLNNFGRVRGTHHMMNENTMISYSPNGYFEEVTWPEL